jgi:hypothetical protein
MQGGIPSIFLLYGMQVPQWFHVHSVGEVDFGDQFDLV